MKELQNIVAAWQALAQGEECVLATVIRTEGSVYRRPGARVLVSRKGWLAGSISGGCLEADLVKTAFLRTQHGAVVEMFDASLPEDQWFGFGLGCKGKVEVLMEPLMKGTSLDSDTVIDVIAEVLETNVPTHIEYVRDSAGLIVWTASDGAQPGATPDVIFEETIVPPLHLLVYGAGNDAIPLTQLASQLGWRVTLVDGRSEYANSTRFPTVDRIELNSANGQVFVEQASAVVIMTHSYTLDLKILSSLASVWPNYCGILGPRARSEMLCEGAKVDINQVHAPMGLDLGAETPEEIAISVVAEILACIKGTRVRSLKEKATPIHER